jgi:tRNA A37 N6-isopentenylltransferase MiaA
MQFNLPLIGPVAVGKTELAIQLSQKDLSTDTNKAQ